MKIYEVKRKGNIIYFPENYGNAKYRNGILEFFIYGEGYSKTKNFRVLPDVELPDGGDLSWLEICKIHEKYGIEVSNVYSNRKVAGIVSRQTIIGKYELYKVIKDIIPENFDSFFEILPFDYEFSCFGIYMFDIFTLDQILSEMDSEYNGNEAKYKGKPISMMEYITLKYGTEYCSVIEKLLGEDNNGLLAKS